MIESKFTFFTRAASIHWGDADTYRSQANSGVGARWALFLCLQ